MTSDQQILLKSPPLKLPAGSTTGGPSTFHLRAILQKRDNLRAISNKMMYKITDSQYLKLKKRRYVRASLKVLHTTVPKSKLLQISVSGMPAVEASLKLYRSFGNTSVSGGKSETMVLCFVCHYIYVFTVDLTCFIVENVRTLAHVCVSERRAHFNAKYFSLGNLSLLTNFQKLFTVTNTVSIVVYIFIKRSYACSTVIKIAYCRDGQLIWFKGNFVKVAFS